MNTSAFEKAIRHFGSQSKMADALGVHRMSVTQWKKRGVPPFRARQIEEVTGGEVTRVELLPELFGRVVGV